MRSAVVTWLFVAALAAVWPAQARGDSLVVPGARADALFALGGTLVYHEPGGAWMRRVDGRVTEARGVPAGAFGGTIGRDRAGRVVLIVSTGGDWRAYHVAADRSHRLRGLPGGCPPTSVALWRDRLAYAVECAARAGVFLREGGLTRRVASARWAAGWSTRVVLRGDTLIASRVMDDTIATHLLAKDGRACRAELLAGSDLEEEWWHYGPWLSRGRVMWWSWFGSDPGGLVGARLGGRCAKVGRTGSFELAAPPLLGARVAVDGRWLYHTAADGIRRQLVPREPSTGVPANDDFEAATPLVGDPPISVTVTLGYATSQPGEPYYDSRMGTIWYAFRPATTQTVWIGKEWPLVFAGAGLRSLTSAGEVASEQPGWVRLDAVAGTTYWVRLACSDGSCHVPQHLLITNAPS
jgi:hypothetical protein